MSRASSFILVSVLLLGACGQKGPLHLPTGDAAAQRATLPQTLRPGTAVEPANPASTPTGAANPTPR
ncbi:LPS translocon maturation chaperone LptM [Ramlibacter albus]|uniref:Lipoprotein n=1 Tax=Ramlibacter albus TaxID=2079448 RepID=A0A923M8Q4_9BURK|nr:lipoprotein [Ramlibacter albus]MBC5764844.1 lipoprotein [Ramlibacter albus]